MSDQTAPIVPGEVIVGEEPIRANVGRRTATVRVTNTSVWPVHVGSHFHFFEVNRRLRFDRAAAFGMHLDILARRDGPLGAWPDPREFVSSSTPGRREVNGFNGMRGWSP